MPDRRPSLATPGALPLSGTRRSALSELLRLYRPKSFLKLILIGFALVALPLIFGLAHTTIYVGRLAEHSQRAVYQAVRTTQASQMLVEQITAMERSARQFHVLRDENLFKVYADTHEEFRQTVAQLSALPLDDTQRFQLNKLAEKERLLFHTLHGTSPEPETGATVTAEFITLAELAEALLAGSNRLVDREVDLMERMAGTAQRVLVWQAFALVPGTVIFAAVFIILIARPVRQLDDAIHRLGEGTFEAPVRVTGPKDLEYLGQQLDWLRLRLLDLEEEKRRFLRHVSHELKTPLTAIRESSELLSDEVVGELNSDQGEIVSILRQNSIHLQRLIEDLLSFSMAQGRSAALQRRPVDLAELIRAVAADHKPAMKAKDLQWRPALLSMVVEGDADKLRVVIDNLLSNAVKFSPRGGSLKVSLSQDKELAVMDVVDDGPGISPEDRERVFTAFYQGKAIPEGHVKGTGIGLSIAKDYVSAHGGRIEVVDEPDRGAHFRVTLPLRSAAVLPAP